MISLDSEQSIIIIMIHYNYYAGAFIPAHCILYTHYLSHNDKMIVILHRQIVPANSIHTI